MPLRLALVLTIIASQISAETLEDLRASTAGREVDISGYIGTGLNFGDDEELTFMDDARNTYPVVFDAGRDARRSLEGCEFQIFGGGEPCRLIGQAEIELDGSRLRLIIFSVDSINPPAPLPR